jgi:hypothetical protein
VLDTEFCAFHFSSSGGCKSVLFAALRSALERKKGQSTAALPKAGAQTKRKNKKFFRQSPRKTEG